MIGGAILLMAALLAADWPRFRGPNGSGVADIAGAPAQFGPSANVIWKLALPPGHSSPVLSESRVFLTAFENGKLYTYAIDRAKGAAPRMSPRPQRASRQTKQPGFAQPRNRRRERLCLLRRLWSDLLLERRPRALAHAAGAVSEHIRDGRLADPGGRQSGSGLRPGDRLLYSRRGQKRRAHALEDDEARSGERAFHARGL